MKSEEVLLTSVNVLLKRTTILRENQGKKGLIYAIGRGPLGQKVARNLFSLHPSGKHLVCGLFKRHIGTLLPKEVPKQKTCPIPRKRVICDYLLLNYITGKNVKFLVQR